MNPSFSETTLNSFYQWLDHRILSQGGAFYANASKFRYQPDSTLGTGYVAYAAPCKSLVWDSGIPGAFVLDSVSGYFFDPNIFIGAVGTPPYTTAIFPQVSISGGVHVPLRITLGDNCYFSIVGGSGIVSGQSIFFPDNIAQTGALRVTSSGSGSYQDINFDIDGNPSVITRADGMMVDYVNGRVILPSFLGTTATISGSYSFKEMNVYYANQSQERMVFTNKYYLNSRFNRTAATSTPPPYSMVTPCIFITNNQSENEPWAFGGVYKTVFHITLNVLAENLSQLEGVLSILEDSRKGYFPQLDASEWPLNSYGDFKNGTGYSYDALVAQNGQPGNLYTIEEVKTSKVGDGVKINESVFLGICDLTISKPRSIR